VDERLRISLWMVSGGGLGTALGGAFGGLAGALYAKHGGAAGTAFGRKVADAFARTAERKPSPIRQAAITGAADGVLFLGIVGTLSGAGVAIIGNAPLRWLGVAALGSASLVGGAAFFGLLAYATTRHSAQEFLGALAGGVVGALLAARLLGSIYGPLGLVPGLLVGKGLAGMLRRRYAPRFHPPRAGKVAPRPPTDAGTDITGAPHSRPDNDSFHKPGLFEEE
jgi:hypothetical protein